jgi:hypothetical protein
MSLVNPNIALSTRGVELQDPLAQYGRVMAIQQAGNQNALAQYQLGAAQRGEARDIARTNALAGAGSDETAVANALLKSGDIPAYSAFVKAIEDRKTQRLTQQKTQGEISAQPLAMQKAENDLFDTSMKQIRGAWGNVRTIEDAMAIHDATHRDPVINKRLQAFGITEQMGRQQILDAARDPASFASFVQKAQLGAEKFMEMNKPTTQVVDQSGQRQVIQIPGLGGAPTTVGTYADVPLPAAVEAQRSRIAQAGKPVTTITNVQEKAEAGAFGKMLVDQYGDISKAAGLAIKTLPSIEANLSALNKGLDTGFGTDAKAAGARVLGALGVKDAEKFATDTQTFQSNAISAVLQKQLEQKGPQTESDARRIEQVGAELGKTKGANQFILDLAKEQLRRDIEQRNFYDGWRKRTGSFDGAENAWFSGEGGKSLFDRPALKKYAAGTASAAAQIPGNAPAPARAAPAARTVVRTGTLNGRRVIQYSDGSTEYGN